MPDIRIRGMSSTYVLVSKLYRILAAAMPEILRYLTPAEQAVMTGLMAAIQSFLEQAPFPGTDDDPGTPA